MDCHSRFGLSNPFLFYILTALGTSVVHDVGPEDKIWDRKRDKDSCKVHNGRNAWKEEEEGKKG